MSPSAPKRSRSSATRAPRKSSDAVRSSRSTTRKSLPSPPDSSSPGGIRDAAVLRATGRDWQTWRKVLDAAGARNLTHARIAVLVHEKFGVGEWWSQMVTVGYEQLAGLRDKYQKTDGYSVSGSRVIAVPVERLYAAFEQDNQRRRWLAEEIVIRKATPHKSMRITWTDGKSSVNVNFYAKPGDKSSVQVEHAKLTSPAAARRMKKFWSGRLDALRELLES